MELKSSFRSSRYIGTKVFRRAFYSLFLLVFCLISSSPLFAEDTLIGEWTGNQTQFLLHYGVLSDETPYLVAEIQLSDGWHTYYKEPGETGYGLKFTVNLPEGIQANDLLWQPPQPFHFLGEESLGYSGKAFFFMPLSDPLPAGTRLQFSADYLVCETTCIPEFIQDEAIVPRGSPMPFSSELQVAQGTAKSTFMVSPASTDWSLQTVGLMMFFGLIGGLILNLMPCVFPVLSLKLLGLVSQQELSDDDRKREGRQYLWGIQVAFLALVSLLLGLKQLGVAVGWGFQMQNATYVFALILILAWVMWHLLDLLPLPEWLATVPSKTGQVTATHPFWTGVLVVAVATPCTAPFMAPAIGVALTLPYWGALVIFQSLALGLALPFLVLAYQPRWTRFLPKPGPWMVRVKQVSAIPMGLAIVWLVWVLFQQLGWVSSLLSVVAIVMVLAFRWSDSLVKAGALTLGIVGIAVSLSFISTPILQNLGDWERFSESRLAELRETGQAVLVDVTAAWCLTCQYNERTVLKTDAAKVLFDQRKITVLVADWTRRDAEITRYLQQFGREGVPLYVYYAPNAEPILLPEILTLETLDNTLR